MNNKSTVSIGEIGHVQTNRDKIKDKKESNKKMFRDFIKKRGK